METIKASELIQEARNTLTGEESCCRGGASRGRRRQRRADGGANGCELLHQHTDAANQAGHSQRKEGAPDRRLVAADAGNKAPSQRRKRGEPATAGQRERKDRRRRPTQREPGQAQAAYGQEGAVTEHPASPVRQATTHVCFCSKQQKPTNPSVKLSSKPSITHPHRKRERTETDASTNSYAAADAERKSW